MPLSFPVGKEVKLITYPTAETFNPALEKRAPVPILGMVLMSVQKNKEVEYGELLANFSKVDLETIINSKPL